MRARLVCSDGAQMDGAQMVLRWTLDLLKGKPAIAAFTLSSSTRTSDNHTNTSVGTNTATVIANCIAQHDHQHHHHHQACRGTGRRTKQQSPGMCIHARACMRASVNYVHLCVTVCALACVVGCAAVRVCVRA